MSLLRSVCAVLSAFGLVSGAVAPRAEFTEFVRRETERWRKVAREANIQPEG